MNEKLKLTAALAIGTALGATLGLLFAPASGKRTRRKIQKTGGRMLEDASDSIKHTAEEVATSVGDQLKDLSDKSSKKWSNVKEKIS